MLAFCAGGAPLVDFFSRIHVFPIGRRHARGRDFQNPPRGKNHPQPKTHVMRQKRTYLTGCGGEQPNSRQENRRQLTQIRWHPLGPTKFGLLAQLGAHWHLMVVNGKSYGGNGLKTAQPPRTQPLDTTTSSRTSQGAAPFACPPSVTTAAAVGSTCTDMGHPSRPHPYGFG